MPPRTKSSKAARVLALTTDSIIAYMQKLVASPEFEVLVGLQGIERERIITEGKRTLDPNTLAELRGSDRASNIAFVWAKKERKQDSAEREYESPIPGENQ